MPLPSRPGSRAVDRPEPGHFLIKLVKGGPWVVARIEHAFGLWSASIMGEECGARAEDPVRADGVFRIWHFGKKITAEEYERRLKATPQNPDQPINLRQKDSLF